MSGQGGTQNSELKGTSQGFREKILEQRARMRSSLAEAVLIVAGIIAVLALVLVWVVACCRGLDDTQSVALFQTTFSLIFGAVSAWGGAIIAFYFGGENFEAAARATQDVIETNRTLPPLSDIPVSNAMITDIDHLEAVSIEELTVEAIDAFFARAMAPRRLVVFTPGRKFLAVLHKSTLDEAKAINLGEGGDPLTTLASVLEKLDEASGALVTSAAFVSISATLQQMKGAMDAKRGCQDGFVTTTGDIEGVVLGYVTNVEINAHAMIR